jgi:hypothetical protein
MAEIKKKSYVPPRNTVVAELNLEICEHDALRQNASKLPGYHGWFVMTTSQLCNSFLSGLHPNSL